jgi:IS4 transposase
LICDQRIVFYNFYAARHYPAQLRRIRYRDPETDKNLVFLTNQTLLPPLTICALYKSRWHVELFFKWGQAALAHQAFYGTSENAVKTQVWIAVSVYVLVAIIKKELKLEASLHTLLQILSVTLFEKMPLQQALAELISGSHDLDSPNQLNLFDS